MINIRGMNKAAVLAALYNASSPRGMGMRHAQNGDMTVEQAQKLIDANTFGYFDYVHGRPLKVDLSKDEFDEHLYERDNGSARDALKVVGLLP